MCSSPVKAAKTNAANYPRRSREQVRQAFDNLLIALEAVGATARDVAKLTVMIVDHGEERLQRFGEEVERVFGPGSKPACTLIPVPRLALDGMLFEVETIAAMRD